MSNLNNVKLIDIKVAADMKKILLAFTYMFPLLPALTFADDGTTIARLQSAIDGVWVMLAAILVIFMQAGFVLLEAG